VFLFMLLFAFVFLVLFGIGVGVGLACAACASLLVAMGIVSSSALVAMCRRRMSSGLRAFHYQICASLGIPAGVFLLSAASIAFDLRLRPRPLMLIGAGAGIAAGLLLAFVCDRLARLAYNRFIARSELQRGIPCAR
jgi:hypothetical protein